MAKVVRLKSNHDKFLVADEDEEIVLQSRKGSSLRARWTVEFIKGDAHRIRLKSCYGKYLTALDEPYLLGMAGKKILQLQDMPALKKDTSSIDWEPRTEGSYVKLRTRGGTFLRANGGVPPWRNSVTHGVPHRTASQDWILWGVDVVDIQEFDSTPAYHKPSPASSLSSSDSVDSECLDTNSQLVCIVPGHGYSFARAV